MVRGRLGRCVRGRDRVDGGERRAGADPGDWQGRTRLDPRRRRRERSLLPGRLAHDCGRILGLVGLVGFYEALRGAGEWLLLAPILGVVGLTLVTISHLLPIAMAYELVPNFTATQADTFDTFAALAQVLNYTGDVILWGVVVPMYAVAILDRACPALDRVARRRCRRLRRPRRGAQPGLERHRRDHLHRLRRVLRLDGGDGRSAASWRDPRPNVALSPQPR